MTRFCTQEMVSTRSRAKAAGFAVFAALDNALAFQLAAARRRLADPNEKPDEKPQVSTRSRAKAAGGFSNYYSCTTGSFNSQPREGGWCDTPRRGVNRRRFNSQPREGGWLAQNTTDE